MLRCCIRFAFFVSSVLFALLCCEVQNKVRLNWNSPPLLSTFSTSPNKLMRQCHDIFRYTSGNTSIIVTNWFSKGMKMREQGDLSLIYDRPILIPFWTQMISPAISHRNQGVNHLAQRLLTGLTRCIIMWTLSLKKCVVTYSFEYS